MSTKEIVKLIVGLGNPGSTYKETRHNVGVWFVERLLQEAQIALNHEKKFYGLTGKTNLFGNDCHLLIPETYMNHSGQSVAALARFYKIPSENILVAHDDLDIDVGTIKLKKSGGHAGHNGLRDIISSLGSAEFIRLRIGIGHPGQRNRVHDYVLGKPNKHDKISIDRSIEEVIHLMPDVLNGNLEKAMQVLHSKESK